MKFPLVIALFFYIPVLQGQDIPNIEFAKINTMYNELNPVLSPDGKTLFFTIANHPSNVGGKRDPGDVWISTLQGSKWSQPIHGGSFINDRAYNAAAGLSPDGNDLYLLSHYDSEGNTPKTQGISVSKKVSTGWARPRNISIPYFQNKSTFLSGTLTKDLQVFIFSAETYGTRGVDDLYVSLNENGKWTEPRNLGVSLNTQFQELSPSLSDDGQTLYFSSNGRKGYGSFDIYSANRLDDTWMNWSEPVNVGSSINSDGRELFFRDYRALGLKLLTSTKNSDGYGDVKFHLDNEPIVNDPVISLNVPKPDTIYATIDHTTPAVVEKKNAVKVYGKVSNSKTGELINANLNFSAADTQSSAGSTGSGYSIDIPPSEIYHIKIEAPGYVSVLEKLDITSYETQELEMNFSLQPVAVGTTVNLKNVLFIQTKTELLPESFDELDVVVSFLKTNPGVKIELSGHTDNRGIHADNIRLSQQRVNSVKQYLVSKGVDPKRISGKGHGGLKPIASNETEETRMMNRRVEFIIKKF